MPVLCFGALHRDSPSSNFPQLKNKYGRLDFYGIRISRSGTPIFHLLILQVRLTLQIFLESSAVDKEAANAGRLLMGGNGVSDAVRLVAAPFLVKTYRLVDDPSTDHIVSWGDNNNTIVVWRPKEFSAILLPTYFNHTNFSSFVRQLNTYVRFFFSFSFFRS